MLTNSLLWRLERNQLTSYLYGSVHIQDRRVFCFVPALTPFIEETSVFAAELNFDDIATQTDLRDTDEDYPNTWSYKDELRPKVYLRLAGILNRAFNVKIEQVDHLSPIMLVQHLTILSLGKDLPHNLDLYLWNIAKSKGKACQGLETWHEQSAIYKKMENSTEMRELNQVTDNVSAFKKSIKTLLDLYLLQDIQRLYKKTRRTLGPYRKIMINQRNKILAERYYSIAKNQSLFAAVGAAHLVGEFGLLRQLKHMGFTVSPIKIT